LIDEKGKIYLEPKIYEFKEIIVENSKKHYKRVGWTAKKRWKYGTLRTKNGQALTKINWKNIKGRIQDFMFRVDSLRVDSMLVKVKFYEDKNGIPGELLIKDNVFYMLKRNTKDIAIDLKPYGINVKGNFWVGLQAVESWDKEFWGGAVIMMEKASSGNVYYTFYNRIDSDESSFLKGKGVSYGYNLLIEY
jgi:hypothetical protein